MLSSRRRTHSLDIWPGFVDALSALLMVIIFVLMTFVLSQMYLSYALSTREKTLAQQDTHIAELLRQLTAAQTEKTTTAEELAALKTTTQQLQVQHDSLQHALQQTTHEKAEAIAQAAVLRESEHRLSEMLAQEQATLSQQKVMTTSLKDDTDKKAHFIKILEEEIATLKKKSQESLSQFRSEFLAKLQKIVGERSDIRIVGDRFVFQSEVFFDVGSAELGTQGKEQLNQLAKALKEIAAKIPADIKWILRVDGHTDHRPIKNKFASNWDLSAGRALSVVRFLILQGVEPEHLVAAGFGEFQPLVKESHDEQELARNRRIEFRLDQR